MTREDLAFLNELMDVIESRRDDPRPESYVSDLLGDPESVRSKVLEEADELAAASEREPEAAVVHEAADVVFHVLVLLALHDLDLKDLVAELEGRRTHETG